MLAPEGRDNGDERDTPLSPDAARKGLEEGATEAWAYRNLDRYIDELGLEDVVPDLKGVTAISRYQHYLPAADVLAERIGAQAGVGRDEILRQMNCGLSDGKWPVARIEEGYRSGTPLQQERQAGQVAQPQQQPDQKDVLAVAFAGTAPAGGATATRPGQAALNKSPVSAQQQNTSTREETQSDR
ncbi:hypothetical protein JOF29_007828 [Kribbella aluminosa]|uniref:Uncharacterized protein n=1 Tax=Kribbella aluminosa TaxID=416017 RepID=A0ABS4UYI1_9ACTN|nr:hypothetical protein [Kribbella aluminosa]MBP2356718.1 hypothetical protein [Kribbella aluminosa]